MYPHQVERLTAVLERRGLAALVATQPVNIAYVTGFRSLTQEVYGTGQLAVFGPRGTALVVPAVDLAAIVADGVEVDHVTCFGGFVSSYAESLGEAERRVQELADGRLPSPADALARALEALGVGGGTIGLDDGHITQPAWERLAKRLTGMSLVAAAADFGAARRIKSPYEIECLQRALGIAEEATNAVIQMLKPGVTEREAAGIYETEVVKRGGSPYGRIVAMGERAAIPAPYPSDRALRRGDLVRLDLGCVFKGYHGEVARTAVMGEPDARQARAFRAIEAGLDAALAAIGPGALSGRVFDVAVEATRAAGLAQYRRYHVGHGIGLEPYERPKLMTGNATPLEMGEVLRVETPYYEHGWSGLSVKETVLVTQNGGHVLNRSNRGLIVLD